MGKVGSVRPIGGEDTAKLPCLEEGAAAACSMPLKPGTLWHHLAILVGAPLGKQKVQPLIDSGGKMLESRHLSLVGLKIYVLLMFQKYKFWELSETSERKQVPQGGATTWAPVKSSAFGGTTLSRTSGKATSNLIYINLVLTSTMNVGCCPKLKPYFIKNVQRRLP